MPDSILVYSYDELPTEEAKAEALEQVRRILSENFDSDQMSDEFKEQLEELGYCNMDVAFSLNYCQGDGMAFYGIVSGSNMIKVAERVLNPDDFTTFKALHEGDDGADFFVEISKNSYGSHYSHYNTMAVELDCNYRYDEMRSHPLWDTLRDAIKADVKETSKRLEKEGYAEIEFQQSDAQVLETIEANDGWRFEEDGKMRRSRRSR